MRFQYQIESYAKSMKTVFQKGKTPYKPSLPGFPPEGIFNTLEIFLLTQQQNSSAHSSKDPAVLKQL